MWKLILYTLCLSSSVVFMVYIIIYPPNKQDSIIHTTREEPVSKDIKLLSSTDTKTIVDNVNKGIPDVSVEQTWLDIQQNIKIEKNEAKTPLFTLKVDFRQRWEWTYELHWTITSDEQISKVSVESCNSSRNSDKLDNEPYTLKSIKKSSIPNTYSFYYKIGPKQKNICTVPYQIRIYDNKGELLNQSAHRFEWL